MIFFIICIFLLCFYHLMIIFRNSWKKNLILNKYKTIEDIFASVADLSFSIIYKDQLISFHLDGYSIPSEVLETSQRNYIKLTKELLGVARFAIMIDYYGNEKCFLTNLISIFNSKIEDSSLTVTSIRQTE